VGRQRILAIQEGLRAHPPTRIAGHTVTAFADRQDEAGVFGPIISGTDRTARDVLCFQLGPDRRLVIRPSGTEPKTKIYAEAIVPAGDDIDAALAVADAEARAIASDFVRQALALVGLVMPDAGLHCSPLLGVLKRQEFGDSILPEAQAHVREGMSGVALRTWLEGRVSSWGGDGIGMTAPGLRWWRRKNPGPEWAELDEAWLG
jgi:hypothetical protein